MAKTVDDIRSAIQAIGLTIHGENTPPDDSGTLVFTLFQNGKTASKSVQIKTDPNWLVNAFEQAETIVKFQNVIKTVFARKVLEQYGDVVIWN